MALEVISQIKTPTEGGRWV